MKLEFDFFRNPKLFAFLSITITLVFSACSSPAASAQQTTVKPIRLNTVLSNPGMGFVNFHFGWWCDLPPINFSPKHCAKRVKNNWPKNHPASSTAYFRWFWRDLEPETGKINFDLIDTAIQSANEMGETFSLRVMMIDESNNEGLGIPKWLAQKVKGQYLPGPEGIDVFWPDVRDSVFLSEHKRFIKALGERYGNHPAFERIEIGSYGCWGEWNTACLDDGELGIFAASGAKTEAEIEVVKTGFQTLINDFVAAFPNKPIIMLGIGSDNQDEMDVFINALKNGTGWRVDCWGDWGLWSNNWSHQTTIYPNLIKKAKQQYADFSNVWKKAPVDLEVCGVMKTWADKGWTTNSPNGKVQKSFDWALKQHASLINAKYESIPKQYVEKMNQMLTSNGYRFIVDSFSHDIKLKPGGLIHLNSVWENQGVAPSYNPRKLSYRLINTDSLYLFESTEDIRNWLPGSWEINEEFRLPNNISKGEYRLEVALLDQDGNNPKTKALPPLKLAIEGRQPDGWYTLSKVSIE